MSSDITNYLKGLAGMSVHVDEKLTGAKRGVLHDGALRVSPAMYSLMQTASEEELQELCKQIECLDTTNYEMRLIMVAKKIPDSLKGWI